MAMPWDEEDLQHGPVPLWFQISERLRDAIESGEFGPGDPLPSEAALNRRFGISRTTARAALDRLENDGLVSRRSGRGSIVLPPKVDQPVNLLASFSEDMKARGRVPGYRTISVRVAEMTTEVRGALGGDCGEPAVVVDRLLLADGEAIASSVSWLSPAVVPTGSCPDAETLDGTSLYQWIEETTRVRVAAGEQYIEGGVAVPPLDERLGIDAGDPVLTVRRLARSADGRAVEYVVMHYRADRYRFRIESVRP